MLCITFCTILVAAVTPLVTAVPAPRDLFERDGDIIESIVYKRDAVLTARDMELAELHGVDTREMFKHTVMRRADGDDYTIWVHNSFNESLPEDVNSGVPVSTAEETPQLGKRQLLPLSYDESWVTGTRSDSCGDSSFIDDTGPHAPFTGGVLRMVRWGRYVRGHFHSQGLRHFDTNHWRNLVVAGSNSGANARFAARTLEMNKLSDFFIGADDVADLARDTNNRFARQFNGNYRVRAGGGMRCDPWTTLGFNRPWVEWTIGNTDWVAGT